MPKKKIRLPVTLGVRDEAQCTPEIRDSHGRVTQEARVIVHHIPAGQEVELDAAEADRLLDRFGPYVELPAAVRKPTVSPTHVPFRSDR